MTHAQRKTLLLKHPAIINAFIDAIQRMIPSATRPRLYKAITGDAAVRRSFKGIAGKHWRDLDKQIENKLLQTTGETQP